MSETEKKRQQLLARLSRGLVYTTPLLAAVAGAASLHAIISDITDSPRQSSVTTQSSASSAGSRVAAPEANAEAGPEASAEASPEAAPEAMPEASQ